MSSNKLPFLVRLAHSMCGCNKDLAGPYEIDLIAEGIWLYASDGKSIVLVEKQYWDSPVAAPDSESFKKVLPFLTVPAGKVHTASLNELRDFLGVGHWTEVCPVCDGKSKRSEYLSCSFCDSNGEVGVEPRFSWIFGMSLDANRLACLLEPFDEKQVNVVVNAAKGGQFTHEDKILYVLGKHFRVILMGMRASYTETEKWRQAPRFPKERP
jgi:hypothetical protein